MAREISFLKPPGALVLVMLSLFILTQAKASPPANLVLAGQRLSLQPWLTALETASPSTNAADLLHHPDNFVPLSKLPKGNPVDYYWLRTSLQTTDRHDPGKIVTFKNLTYVDFYLYEGDTLVTHKMAGAFRPGSDLADGDGRFYSSLPLERNKSYTLLIRVHHTKYYQPVFDFEMLPKAQFFDGLRIKESLDSALFGAIGIIFIYTLLSFIVSRFRPYLWLMLSIAGVGCYTVSNSGYWIDWFATDHPASAWLLNAHFLYLGLLGMYLLVADFWRLRTDFPKVYTVMRWVPALLAVRALSALGIDYFTGNYYLSGLIDRASYPLMLGAVLYCVIGCWRRLSPPQRYLGYGMMILCASGLFLTLFAVLGQEKALSSMSVVGNGFNLAMFLCFATGLKAEMRRHELAKQLALEELNRLQQHQNSLLEKRVEERTEALRITNKRLQNQKYQLAERNTKIELLINELNHRVKNNLQLLYSLLSLQLPIVSDGVSREILKGNISKIRAMMLVNEKLYNFEKGRNIGLCEFVTEVAIHLQKIYDTKEKTRIQQDIPSGLRLSDKHTLSFGLILSELFTNTFKHAFKDHPDPCIVVKAVAVNDHLLEFSYSDNGAGISGGEATEKYTMGIPLIKDLTRQMNGQITISGDKGLNYSFTIPV
jgi:two-component sensor histidine kinase